MTEETEKRTRLRRMTELRLRIWFPDDQVGKVIGKKGVVIQHIGRETNTELIMLPAAINTNNSETEYSPEVQKLLATANIKSPDELWTPATLTGSAVNVLKAFEMLRALVGDEIDDVVAKFSVPRAKHSLLHCIQDSSNPQYHYNNMIVKKLSADHNVRVHVPDGVKDTSPYVTVEGEFGSVMDALDVLMGVLYERLDIVPELPPPPKHKKAATGAGGEHERGPVILGRGAIKALNSALNNPTGASGKGDIPAVSEKPKKKLLSTGSVLARGELVCSTANYRHLPLDSDICPVGAPNAQSYEIMVDIPTKILGLLLARRNAVVGPSNPNKLSGNVLTQIQQATGTLICMKNDKYLLAKRDQAARRAAEAARRKEKAERAAAVEERLAMLETKRLRKKQELHSGNKMAALVLEDQEDSEDSHGSDSESGSDSDDGSMVSARSGGYDSEGFADAIEGELTNESSGPDASSSSAAENSAEPASAEFAQYRVRGAKLQFVHAAVGYVARIVAGESIHEVLDDVCSDPKCQHRPVSDKKGRKAFDKEGKGKDQKDKNQKHKKDKKEKEGKEPRPDKSGRVVRMEKDEKSAKGGGKGSGGEACRPDKSVDNRKPTADAGAGAGNVTNTSISTGSNKRSEKTDRGGRVGGGRGRGGGGEGRGGGGEGRGKPDGGGKPSGSSVPV